MRAKKKSRWKRVVLWSSLSLAVILITSLFVLDYAVDRVLRSMSGVDTILEEIADSDDSTDNNGETENLPDDSNHDIPIEDESTAPNENTDSNEAVDQPDQSSQAKDTTAKPTQVTTPTDSNEPVYKAEVSTDKAKEIEENASVSEKATVATLLMKNLNADDIRLLSDLASGGLNLKEKKAARALILEKLSEEEYNKLISIAQKFGVSQGKQYSEVIKEE